MAFKGVCHSCNSGECGYYGSNDDCDPDEDGNCPSCGVWVQTNDEGWNICYDCW